MIHYLHTFYTTFRSAVSFRLQIRNVDCEQFQANYAL
jgi:hypothetical protein